MAIVKHIDGIPAFTTISEATTWGRRELNLNGYHIHSHNGNKAYMAGLNHEKIIDAQYNKYLGTQRQKRRREGSPIPKPKTIPMTPLNRVLPVIVPQVVVPQVESTPVVATPVYIPPSSGSTGGSSGSTGGSSGGSGGGGGGGY